MGLFSCRMCRSAPTSRVMTTIRNKKGTIGREHQRLKHISLQERDPVMLVAVLPPGQKQVSGQTPLQLQKCWQMIQIHVLVMLQKISGYFKQRQRALSIKVIWHMCCVMYPHSLPRYLAGACACLLVQKCTSNVHALSGQIGLQISSAVVVMHFWLAGESTLISATLQPVALRIQPPTIMQHAYCHSRQSL